MQIRTCEDSGMVTTHQPHIGDDGMIDSIITAQKRVDHAFRGKLIILSHRTFNMVRVTAVDCERVR